MRQIRFLSFLLICAVILGAGSSATHTSRETHKQKVALAYAELPLSFEVNEGQVDASVKFLSRAGRASATSPKRALTDQRPLSPSMH